MSGGKLSGEEKDKMIFQLNNQVKHLYQIVNELNDKITINKASIGVLNVIISDLLRTKEFPEIPSVKEEELLGFMDNTVAQNYIVVRESLLFDVVNSKLIFWEPLTNGWVPENEGIIVLDPKLNPKNDPNLRKYYFHVPETDKRFDAVAPTMHEAFNLLSLHLVKERQNELSSSIDKTT